MIRYDSNYNANIQRVVSNFNRKVARLNKAGVTNIPQKVSIRDLKTKYFTRSEMNQQLRDLQLFSKRGSENLVTINGKEFTQYDIDLFRRRLQTERRRLSQEIQRAESFKSKYPMQHDIHTSNMKARRAALSGNWSKLITSSMRERIIYAPYNRSEIYDNYLEVLFQDAYQMGYDDTKLNYIKEKLLELPPRKFMQALESDPNIQYIFEYYHSLTRTSQADPNATDAFDQLYENIDEIVAQYK